MNNMVNLRHLELLKRGSKAIEEWQLEHKGENFDLSWARLCQLDLSGFNLQNANLNNSDLSFTNLSRANLSKASFGFASLGGANLTEANLFESDLRYAVAQSATLSHTNLSQANLTGAILQPVQIDERPTNLDRSIINGTSFIFCSMDRFENLDTIKHEGPSHVTIDTLLFSYTDSDAFETKLVPFFLNAGVPKSLLDSLPDIVAGILYRSCFVCYGEPDKLFAEKMVKDLKSAGVRCWIYSIDSTPGQKVWPEIIQRRRELDKMIVLCSAKSLIRDGVKKEIEEQLDEEPEKLIPISLDDLWREEGFLVLRGKRDLKQDLIDRTYADFSDPSNYQSSFRRLLKGLKKSRDSN